MKEESLAIEFFVAGQMVKAKPNCIAGASYQSVNCVALFEQQFREVRAVLAGDASYKCGFSQCIVGAL